MCNCFCCWFAQGWVSCTQHLQHAMPVTLELSSKQIVGHQPLVILWNHSAIQPDLHLHFVNGYWYPFSRLFFLKQQESKLIAKPYNVLGMEKLQTSQDRHSSQNPYIHHHQEITAVASEARILFEASRFYTQILLVQLPGLLAPQRTGNRYIRVMELLQC